MEIIHVAIAFDQNYSRFFYVLSGSLFDYHRKGELHFHAIITGVTEATLWRLRKFVEDSGHVISFYTVDEHLVNRFVLNDGRTMAAYYRLFFPFLIPGGAIRRILYLDMDTVVHNNLRDFYTIDMAGYPVAAVYDVYVRKQPLLGIDVEGEYFNSGVMLIDLDLWRQLKITEQAIDYLLKYPERILYVDQCALNAVLVKNWKKLSINHNLMYSWIPQGLSRRDLEYFAKNALVIHYTLERPWTMLCRNRLRNLYFHYLRKSGQMTWHTVYTDFAYAKIPDWFLIRLKELYFDLPFLQLAWRSLKSIWR